MLSAGSPWARKSSVDAMTLELVTIGGEPLARLCPSLRGRFKGSNGGTAAAKPIASWRALWPMNATALNASTLDCCGSPRWLFQATSRHEQLTTSITLLSSQRLISGGLLHLRLSYIRAGKDCHSKLSIHLEPYVQLQCHRPSKARPSRAIASSRQSIPTSNIHLFPSTPRSIITQDVRNRAVPLRCQQHQICRQ